MWIFQNPEISFRDNLHEMSNPVFRDKKKMKISLICRLLNKPRNWQRLKGIGTLSKKGEQESFPYRLICLSWLHRSYRRFCRANLRRVPYNYSVRPSVRYQFVKMAITFTAYGIFYTHNF